MEKEVREKKKDITLSMFSFCFIRSLMTALIGLLH